MSAADDPGMSCDDCPVDKAARVQGGACPLSARPRERGERVCTEDDRADDVAGLLRRMRSDHEVVAVLLAALRSTTAEYAPPPWACTGYRTLLRELAELDADTSRHIDVEDRVLRPRFLPAA